jgi:hypothetical protein
MVEQSIGSGMPPLPLEKKDITGDAFNFPGFSFRSTLFQGKGVYIGTVEFEF